MSIKYIILGFLAYLVYNKLLVKVLDWKYKKSRNDIAYYLENQEEIKEYIERKLKRDER